MEQFQNPLSHHTVNTQTLRKSMRRQRLALPLHTRRHAEQSVLRQIRREPRFISSRKVGLYLDAFGEVPTRALINLCFQLRKTVYLPVVHLENKSLAWSRVTRQQWQNQRMTHHRFGMKQPFKQRGVSVKSLDYLFMPLVAFDLKGHRLGMGGGFYDRTLAHCANIREHRKLQPSKPMRVGLAYDFQRVEAIHSNAWDISMHSVVTPTEYRRF
jgi:5-formyltetrahydrofolate cyclo-ligase